MNKKLLTLYILLSGFACNSSNCINSPDFIRCAENERRSVRIVSATDGNLTVSGAIIDCKRYTAELNTIITCCHGSYNTIYGAMNSPTQFVKYSLASCDLFDLHNDETKDGLSDEYYVEVNKYMKHVRSTTHEYGRYAVDTIYNPVGRLLFGNITTDNPPHWMLSKYVKTTRPRDLHLPIDIAMVFAKSGIQAPKYSLPKVNYTNELKDKILNITVYGNPANKLQEHKFTMPFVLSNDHQWFCSVTPVSVDFANMTCGMSGGPCFINDKEFCGTISGYSDSNLGPGMKMHIKTIPNEFIQFANSVK